MRDVEVFLSRETRTRSAWLHALLGPFIRDGRQKDTLTASDIEDRFAGGVLIHQLFELFVKPDVPRIILLHVKVGFSDALVRIVENSVVLPGIICPMTTTPRTAAKLQFRQLLAQRSIQKRFIQFIRREVEERNGIFTANPALHFVLFVATNADWKC